MTADRKPRHPDLIGADAALRRASRRALDLALRTGTACWVMRDGRMVDLAAEVRSRANGPKSPLARSLARKRQMRTLINLRASGKQRDLIEHAARLLGKSCSEFVLEAACDTARAVLCDRVLFNVDAGKFRQFTRLLDAPPARNPGLDRLRAIKTPWNGRAAKG